jgi:S-DNA-T family DNA segregation ATPase FtsK/SpoIIIE
MAKPQSSSEGRFPRWLSEVLAIILIVLGVISLLILMGFSSGTLSDIWYDLARQAFGMVGAAALSLILITFGGVILASRALPDLRLRWGHVTGIEIAYVSALALLHILHPDPEPHALALEGGGGGMIGWALSTLIVDISTPFFGLLIFGLLFLTGALITIGKSPAEWKALGIGLARRVRHLRGKLNPKSVPRVSPRPESAEEEDEEAISLRSPGAPGDRRSIVPKDWIQLELPYETRSSYKDSDGQYNFQVDDLEERRRRAISIQNTMLPPMDMLVDRPLERPPDEVINDAALTIEERLEDFGIEVEVVGVKVGPAVTQFAVSPFTEHVTPGGDVITNRVRVGQIAQRSNDLALALSAPRLRIQAPVPGHSYVGIEVPNPVPSIVSLRPVMESEAFFKVRSVLALPLGRDVAGAPVVADLAQMPHLLIAGTTGSGKSVAISSMLTALVMTNTPEEVNFVLLDPKRVELMRFQGLPHLVGPIETDLEDIVEAMRWLTSEMDRRYNVLEESRSRHIRAYNQKMRKAGEPPMPYIVVMVDEIGDLMMAVGDITESLLTRLAQMARAIGIHLVVATQRPSVDVITGLIKANFPARISFAVASNTDSRVILDTPGAETLLGRGDMLFQPPEAAGPTRIQGCWVSDDEVQRVVEYWEEWERGEIEAGRRDKRSGSAPWTRAFTRREILAREDPKLEDAIALISERKTISTSGLQRRLSVGYPRAARLMDMLEELGMVGDQPSGGKPRDVLLRKNRRKRKE